MLDIELLGRGRAPMSDSKMQSFLPFYKEEGNYYDIIMNIIDMDVGK